MEFGAEAPELTIEEIVELRQRRLNPTLLLRRAWLRNTYGRRDEPVPTGDINFDSARPQETIVDSPQPLLHHPQQHILAQIAANPKLLEVNGLDYLVHRLEELLPSFPDLVFDICILLITSRGTEIINIQRELAMSGPTLVNISLTLQRLGGEFRSMGLEMFEELLELGLLEAQSAMNELDLRPINIAKRERPRRRRQRKIEHYKLLRRRSSNLAPDEFVDP